MKSIAGAVVASARALLERPRDIPIERCYHFRGYRYGGFGNNPYEDYVVGLASGRDIQDLRRAFAQAMLSSAPRTMSEALDIEIHDVPPWQFPWDPVPKTEWRPVVEPAQNPDIVCHSCEAGVLASHINREFAWLEASFRSIRNEGYRPQALGYIRCLCFVAGEQLSYLVLDGNHRIAALHAIGERNACVKVSPRAIQRVHVEGWPRVKDGTYDKTSALRVFDRYFAERNPPLRHTTQASLVIDEPPQWRD